MRTSRWTRLARWFSRTPAPLDPLHWQAAIQRAPWIARLDAVQLRGLQQLAARFLQDKRIVAVAGLELDDAQRTLLATLCCLPLLRYGAEGLRGWSQLIVYPGAFRVRRSRLDDAGVLHEWDDDLIGESWDSGPMLLSWADVQADLDDPHAGFCVAVHEMAHKIDALDGALDGTPPLPHAWQREWARDFQAAFDTHEQQVRRGRRTLVDAYAAEAPEEFFAVCSEYHFSDPHTLERAFPAVAGHLQRFYGVSPSA